MTCVNASALQLSPLPGVILGALEIVALDASLVAVLWLFEEADALLHPLLQYL